MPTTPERLDQLQKATLLHTFHRNLRRSGFGSIGWGLFSILVGLLVPRSGLAGWVNLVLGCLLVVEGSYLLAVRKPIVILLETATLGLLGAVNLLFFALAVLSKVRLVGHPLVGVVLLVGALQTHRAYGVYSALSRQADSELAKYVQQLVEEVRRAKPQNAHDVVELRVERFFGKRYFWRIKFMDDVALFIRSVDQAFGIQSFAVEAFWIKKADVRLEAQGENRPGKDVKVNVCRGAEPFIKKGKINSEMLGKFGTLLKAASPGTW